MLSEGEEELKMSCVYTVFYIIIHIQHEHVYVIKLSLGGAPGTFVYYVCVIYMFMYHTYVTSYKINYISTCTPVVFSYYLLVYTRVCELHVHVYT